MVHYRFWYLQGKKKSTSKFSSKSAKNVIEPGIEYKLNFPGGGGGRNEVGARGGGGGGGDRRKI